ncbi:MAG: four helix bundle protein [Cytophagales bacterium]|nr:MAG: four helix bundle protein [Cytophagales bacterium]
MRPKFKPTLLASRDIVQKSFDFSLSLIEFYIFLIKNNQLEFSERLLKSGTNIRENVEQSIKANSKQEFISKISLASKDAIETRYWLKEIQMKFISSNSCDTCVEQINEIINILNYITQSNCDSEVKLNIEYLN